MGHLVDRFAASLFARGLVPSVLAGPFHGIPREPRRQREVYALLLASALREGWEEMRLAPCNVEYLGGLPTHRLQNFPKFIFPLVGRIRQPWKARLNWEVESIIPVPVSMFLDPANYAIYSQRVAPPWSERTGLSVWELPCLVIPRDGAEEILWGATFRILAHFVETVVGLPLDAIHPKRRIERDLPVDYFTGRRR